MLYVIIFLLLFDIIGIIIAKAKSTKQQQKLRDTQKVLVKQYEDYYKNCSKRYEKSGHPCVKNILIGEMRKRKLLIKKYEPTYDFGKLEKYEPFGTRI